MYVYIAQILLVAAICLCRPNNKLFMLFLLGVIISFPMILRDFSVLTDTENYRGIFERSIQSVYAIHDNRSGIGFYYIARALNDLGLGYRAYLIFSGVVITVAMIRFIYLNSSNVYLAFFIYVVSGTYILLFLTIRQGLAVSIVLITYEYLKQERYIKYIMGIFVASLIHPSAALCVVFILFRKIPFSPSVAILSLIFCCLSIPFMKYSSIILPYLPILNNAYIGYLDSGEAMSGFITSMGRRVVYFLIYLAGLINLYMYTDEIEQELLKELNTVAWIVFMGTAFLVASYKLNVLERVAEYMMPFWSLWIANIADISNSVPSKYIFISVEIVLMLIYSIAYCFINNSWGAVPYSFMNF